MRWAAWATVALFKSKASLVAENLCLRQQLLVLQRNRSRPRLGNSDRRFWVLACRWFRHRRKSLLIVKPETVLGWNREGWKVYWRRRSRRQGEVGRRQISAELKPDNPRESLARMKSAHRRTEQAQLATKGEATPGAIAEFAGWRLDLTKRELSSSQGEAIELTSGEFDLLSVFVRHPQHVLSREQLLDYARGYTRFPFDRSVDVQVMRLRRKIEPDPQDPTPIKTVRNVGYIFTPKVAWS